MQSSQREKRRFILLHKLARDSHYNSPLLFFFFFFFSFLFSNAEEDFIIGLPAEHYFDGHPSTLGYFVVVVVLFCFLLLICRLGTNIAI